MCSVCGGPGCWCLALDSERHTTLRVPLIARIARLPECILVAILPARTAWDLFVLSLTIETHADPVNSDSKKAQKRKSCTIQCTVIRCLQTSTLDYEKSGHCCALTCQRATRAPSRSGGLVGPSPYSNASRAELNSNSPNLAQSLRIMKIYSYVEGYRVASAPPVLPRSKGHRAAGEPIYIIN